MQRQAGFWHLACGHPKWIQISGYGRCRGIHRKELGIQRFKATTHFSENYSQLSAPWWPLRQRRVVVGSSEATWELISATVGMSCQHTVRDDLRRGLCAAHGVQDNIKTLPFPTGRHIGLPSRPPLPSPGVSRVNQCYTPATSFKCRSSDIQVRLQVPGANSWVLLLTWSQLKSSNARNTSGPRCSW